MAPGPRMFLMQQLSQAALSTELIYAFLIIIVSLMIYFATKELYDLTKHKGIQYFRLAFLFFAVAFFFRSFIKIFVFFLEIPKEYGLLINQLLGTGTVFLFMYFSALAIFYLVYSVKYKKWNNKNLTIIIFQLLAIIIGVIVIISKNPYVILAINLLFLTSILFVIFTTHSQRKNKHKSLYVIYILLFVFWILNIFNILIPNFLQFYHLLIYLASISIFLSILYKVLRNIGIK